MLVKFNFLSDKLNKQTNVTMFIPSRTFEDQMLKNPSPYVKDVKYQVMYLLHGGSGDNDDYIKFTNIARYAQDNNLVVVMPSGYNSFYENDHDKALSADYFDYVFEELPEVVQAYFPISLKAEDTFVAGLSMGAHGALKLALLGPEKFNSAYIMSGTYMDQNANAKLLDFENINKHLDDIVNLEHPVYKRAKKNIIDKKAIPKIYMTTGDEDFLLGVIEKSKDLLIEYGYDIDYKKVAGYGHEWDFWDLALKEALYEVLPLKRKAL